MDRDAVAQVFTNLLSNAAKYGADGQWVGLTARVSLDGVDVMVSDRGIGISKADIDHVFDHFFRANTPDVRKRRGTGIGLSIVRYIVEAHGGTISVDSELGEGTTFTVTFPFQPPRDAGA
jgi:two-component system sensor histidine kinase VicK